MTAWTYDPAAHEWNVRNVDPLGDRMATVCGDCGAESAATCPYGADTCSECSSRRERVPVDGWSIAAWADRMADCPAHGAYLPDPEPRS